MDGAGNDIAEANAAGLPIWCRHVTPITTKYRALGGALNVPISCGGVTVSPGDAILADDNGVVVIPRVRLEKVIKEAIAFHQKEADLLAFLRDNPDVAYPDATGVSAIIEQKLREQAE
jgi:regulator of RNase E activity RraA